MPVGYHPTDIEFAGGKALVVNQEEGTVTQVDPHGSETVTRRYAAQGTGATEPGTTLQ